MNTHTYEQGFASVAALLLFSFLLSLGGVGSVVAQGKNQEQLMKDFQQFVRSNSDTTTVNLASVPTETPTPTPSDSITPTPTPTLSPSSSPTPTLSPTASPNDPDEHGDDESDIHASVNARFHRQVNDERGLGWALGRFFFKGK